MESFTFAPCPLPTRWTATVDPNAPHPEHPRPQLRRDTRWINLNGIYQAAIRPAAEPQPRELDLHILVPFPVESALSGLARRVTAADRIWYRRRFQAPAARADHTWLLHFGAVDWRADVWLDGTALGSHEGGYQPFWFDVGALGGEHELLITAWDPTEEGPQPRGKQMLRPNLVQRPFFYSPASGIWQTVWLEEVPTCRIVSLRLRSSSTSLSVGVRLVGSCEGDELRIEASVDGRTVASATAAATAELDLAVPDPHRWSPSDPFLYDLEVSLLRDGALRDRVTSYFALRAVEVRRDSSGVLRIHLNGEPLFLHGLLDQGYWPDGIYTAPCDEALRFDIEETKRLGFNLIRKHVKIEPARWYWHCDRLGMLVFQDMPNGDRMALGVPIGGIGLFDPTRWIGQRGIRRTPKSIAIFERELDAMIDDLGNSPAVVAWVIFNEGWGQFDTVRFAAHVAAADPSRLVDAVSGWVDDPGAGHLRDVHVYHPGPRIPQERDRRRAEILGEWGGLGLEVAGHRWPKRAFAYKRLKSAEELARHYEQRVTALTALARRGFAAAVYTQTTDVEGEVNGLLTYDRQVLKFDAERLRQTNERLQRAVSTAAAADRFVREGQR